MDHALRSSEVILTLKSPKKAKKYSRSFQILAVFWTFEGQNDLGLGWSFDEK